MKRVLMLLLFAALACSGAQGAVTIVVNEVGNDVVATATGTINTAGFDAQSGSSPSGGFVAGSGFVSAWTCGIGVGSELSVDAYTSQGLGNTDVCSTGTRVSADSDSGTYAGLIADTGDDRFTIYVSPGYVSGDPIDGASTWTGESFSSLGLVPGTYVYSWGSGADADSLTVAIGQAAPETYTVGGSVSGLSGSVTLQNNGADDLVVDTNDSFTFPTELDDGAEYDVTVTTQPSEQTCSVSNGSGTISGADVTNVLVECQDAVAPPPVVPDDPPVSVPTLSEWGAAMMILTLLLLTAWRMRGFAA